MVSMEQRDYLALYKSIMDTGAEVVRMYTESKCKSKYGINFATYIDSEKHYFYHQWKMKRKKLFCCVCPSAGCYIRKTESMNDKMFTKWYKFSPNIQVPIGHSDAQHICICQYTAQNLSIEEFDLSDLNFLLKNTKLLSQADACQLEIISTVRNSVCHAVSTNMFTENDLKDLRLKFESATLQLTEELNKRMVKMLLKIEPLLSNEDVEKLMKEISYLHVENNHNMDTVISTIDYYVGKSENNIKHNVTEELKKTENNIKHHVTEVLSCEVQQMKNEVTERSSVLREDILQCTATIGDRIQLAEERIQTTTTLVKQGQNELAGEITESINDAQQQISSDINANTKELHDCLNKNMENTAVIRTEIKSLKDNIEDIVKRVMKEQFAELTARIEINGHRQDSTNTNDQQRQVKFEIKFESDVLNEDKAQTNLTSQTVPYTEECDTDENKITIHSVKKNCILLEASASSNIFRGAVTLRSAIRELIQKVLDAGEVDTSKESTVKVDFQIITPLNDDETQIVCGMVCREKFTKSNQQKKCQENQQGTVDEVYVQVVDTTGDIFSGSHASDVWCPCWYELQKLLKEKDDIIRKKETHLNVCERRCDELQRLLEKKDDIIRRKEKDLTEYANRCDELQRLLEQKDDIWKQKTHLRCARCSGKQLQLLDITHEREKSELKTELLQKDLALQRMRQGSNELQIAYPKIGYKTEQEDKDIRLEPDVFENVITIPFTEMNIIVPTFMMGSAMCSDTEIKPAKEEIKLLKYKTRGVDMFGDTLSLPYASVKSDAEPCTINAGAVVLIQRTRKKTVPLVKRTTTSQAPFEMHVESYSDEGKLHAKMTSTTGTDTKRSSDKRMFLEENPADFTAIAKRFAKFQGFMFHEYINSYWHESVVHFLRRVISAEKDCLIVLIPQWSKWSDIQLINIFREITSLHRIRPTVIISQAQGNDYREKVIEQIFRSQDVIFAMFKADREEPIAKLLNHAMDNMKSGDDFSSVLLAVIKEFNAMFNSYRNSSPSVMISTLLKDLRFNIREQS